MPVQWKPDAALAAIAVSIGSRATVASPREDQSGCGVVVKAEETTAEAILPLMASVKVVAEPSGRQFLVIGDQPRACSD